MKKSVLEFARFIDNCLSFLQIWICSIYSFEWIDSSNIDRAFNWEIKQNYRVDQTDFRDAVPVNLFYLNNKH